MELIAEEEGVSKREVVKVLELSRIVQHIERVARDAGLPFEKTKSILYRSCINQAPCFINYPSDLLNNDENPWKESSECVALKELVQDSLQELNSNEEYSDLPCSLSEGFIDLGPDVELFQRTARALGDANLTRAIDDVSEWQSSREGILKTLIQNYENDPRTQRMVRSARQVNATSGGSRCYSKVKEHMAGRGKYIRGRWSSAYAINAKEDLAERGFINLVDYGFPLDAEQAPQGSVLVYEALDRNLETLDPKVVGPRGAGHVEIVVGNGDRRRYVSDYWSSKPRNQAPKDGDRRKLVRVMIYPTDEKLLSDWEQAENYN